MLEKKWYAGGIRKNVLDWIAAAGICGCLIGAYIKIEYYQIMVKYMPLISVFVMAVFFFNHVNWIESLKNRDWRLYLVIAGIFIELINIKVSHSGFGVILNLVTFLFVLYLADKVKINRFCYYAITLTCLGCLIYWFGKAENRYNTNMASMIAFILAAGTMPGIGICLKKTNHENFYRWYSLLITAAAVALAWKLRARGIMIGIGVFWIISLLIPKCAWKPKYLYRTAVILLLSGGLMLPLIYVWNWKNGNIENFAWLGKNFYTAREKIWIQFFEAFYKEPWTGIGSNIEGKIVDPLFTEVHNGYLHLLFIYGIIIFAILIVLWIYVFWKAQEDAKNSVFSRQNIYMAVGLMISTISENYIVLPAFNLVCFLILTGFYQHLFIQEDE